VKRLSVLKSRKHPIDILLDQLDHGGLSALFQREVRFAPPGLTWRQFRTKGRSKRWKFELIKKPRLWRWDLAAPDLKLSIEYQGGTFKQGAHSRGAGQTRDNLKLIHAELAGWLVLPVDGPMVRHGVAYDLICQAVATREGMRWIIQS
jgi:hypothetical protein